MVSSAQAGNMLLQVVIDCITFLSPCMINIQIILIKKRKLEVSSLITWPQIINKQTVRAKNSQMGKTKTPALFL